MKEQMKEQQVQSNLEQEQMALDRENLLWEQEKLKLLNQQLLAQVTTFQNNPVQIEGNLGNNMSPNLYILDELIQKWIGEARLLDHSNPTTKNHEFYLSKEIQEYEFSKKFSTLTFDYYS